MKGGRGVRNVDFVSSGVGDGEDRAFLITEQHVLPLRHLEVAERGRNGLAVDVQVRVFYE